jgi:RNA methyltransferase, TrmH family
MLSKAKIKFIKSLQIKKYRKQEQCFIVQGAKSVQELISSDFEVLMVLGTEEFLSTTKNYRGESIPVTIKELELISEFESNESAVAVAKMKENTPVLVSPGEFALVLDDIRDPGNLGTIIRTADWYGINKVIASPDTTDLYSPKVIGATMGSFLRVNLYYTDLGQFLSTSAGKVFGAYLDGEDIHQMSFQDGGLILIGNESRGISASLERFVTHKMTIPRYGQAESLNAAIATAIICDNVRRNR